MSDKTENKKPHDELEQNEMIQGGDAETQDAAKQQDEADIRNEDKVQDNAEQQGEADDTKKVISKNPNEDKRLEMLGMSKKEKRRVKKEQYAEATKDMSKTEKLSYLVTYYKWYVIIPVAAAIFLIYLGTVIYKNSIPVALNYVILNVGEEESVNTSFEDNYLSETGLPDNYRFVSTLTYYIDYEYYLENMDFVQTSNSTDYNLLRIQCNMGTYDIIITNETGLKYCTTTDVAYPLKNYFEPQMYEKLSPYEVYAENSMGDSVPFAIDLSDTEFAKNLELNYDDVYVIFPGNKEENRENAIRFLEYALNLTL